MVRVARISLQLRAQLHHEVVDRPERSMVLRAPHARLDFLAAEDTPRALNQAPENVEFGRRERYLLVAPRHLARAGVDNELSDVDQRVFVRDGGVHRRRTLLLSRISRSVLESGAAQGSLDAGQQLGDAE